MRSQHKSSSCEELRNILRCLAARFEQAFFRKLPEPSRQIAATSGIFLETSSKRIAQIAIVQTWGSQEKITRLGTQLVQGGFGPHSHRSKKQLRGLCRKKTDAQGKVPSSGNPMAATLGICASNSASLSPPRYGYCLQSLFSH